MEGRQRDRPERPPSHRSRTTADRFRPLATAPRPKTCRLQRPQPAGCPSPPGSLTRSPARRSTAYAPITSNPPELAAARRPVGAPGCQVAGSEKTDTTPRPCGLIRVQRFQVGQVGPSQQRNSTFHPDSTFTVKAPALIPNAGLSHPAATRPLNAAEAPSMISMRDVNAGERPDLPVVVPTIPASAGALVRGRKGRLLILKPTYKGGWTVPGGVVEIGESPWEACRRETKEECGLDITAGRFVCLDFLRPRPGRPGGASFSTVVSSTTPSWARWSSSQRRSPRAGSCRSRQRCLCSAGRSDVGSAPPVSPNRCATSRTAAR